MARTGICKKCGKRIRPSAADMSVSAASRIHYWKVHREVMMAGVRKAQATRKRNEKKAGPTRKARR